MKKTQFSITNMTDGKKAKLNFLSPEKYSGDRVKNPNPAGWHYELDYRWIAEMIRQFRCPGVTENLLDCGTGLEHESIRLFYEKLGITNIMTLDRQNLPGLDYVGDFLDLGLEADYDFIVWNSSLEHNDDLDTMRECVRKSRKLLKSGGLLLVTFGVTNHAKGFFFPSIGGYVLGYDDVRYIFDLDVVLWSADHYESIKGQYLQSPSLLEKHFRRFGTKEFIYLELAYSEVVK